jgi:transcriptional regulator with XRE-family HTH domain
LTIYKLMPFWQHASAMGNHLKAWRTYRGLTQAALAHAAGTDKSQISKLEHGQRGLGQDWLERLAKALRTTPAGLLSPPGEAASPKGRTQVLADGLADQAPVYRHGPDEVRDADVTEAELLVLDILRDLPKATQRNIIRAAIRQLDHMGEAERKPALPRRRA